MADKTILQEPLSMPDSPSVRVPIARDKASQHSGHVVGLPTDVTEARGCPRKAAERALAEARLAKQRRVEITALTDLGLLEVHEGNASAAMGLLKEALGLVHEMNDGAAESDVLITLAYATLAVGQPARALPLLQRHVEAAEQAGDRFAQKLGLEHLGFAYVMLRDRDKAVASFTRALEIARELGDRKHEADLLWYLAIEYAETGQRDQAIASARDSIELLERAAHPHASWFREHLWKYIGRESPFGPATGDGWNGYISASFLGDAAFSASVQPPEPQSTSLTSQSERSPGLLRMAISAAKAMAKFVASGLKTVPTETFHFRLRTCMACPHHTGLRCRPCGCFTNVKARMAHEVCPLGKW